MQIRSTLKRPWTTTGAVMLFASTFALAASAVADPSINMSTSPSHVTTGATTPLATTDGGAVQNQPPANAASAPSPDYVPACASDPDKLGVERVVEIDADGGPQLGGSHGGRVDFLEQGEILLTFDDGPMRAYTRRVLKALADECTLATFFMVGRMAAADPAMVREVAAAGHTVGSHTWSHKNLGAVSPAAMRRDFEMGVTAVAKANGNASAPFFRFPYLSAGHTAKAMVKARNFATFWIDVDSKDYLSTNPSDVHRRVMTQLAATGRGIILFHDIQPSTVKALPGLLKAIREKGFRVVHAVAATDASGVADYEADVSKAFAARSKKIDDTPLASKSVVWSATPEPDAAASGDSADLPWTPKKTTKPARRAAKKPAQPVAEQLPWQNQIFNY